MTTPDSRVAEELIEEALMDDDGELVVLTDAWRALSAERQIVAASRWFSRAESVAVFPVGEPDYERLEASIRKLCEGWVLDPEPFVEAAVAAVRAAGEGSPDG